MYKSKYATKEILYKFKESIKKSRAKSLDFSKISLFCSEQTVTGITKAWYDVAVVV
ncbi:hypothetical protein QE429_000384 [Bacillus sp. SORGH_AS 510]|nr:hypothetical protein [Bacillus sp. SORGH_AS_0510]